jgi:hypothetical protein
MKQSRAVSLVEAAANVLVGLALAIVTQLILFTVYDFHAEWREHASIAAAFTAVSLMRSYSLRRLFEAWRERSETKDATGHWVWWRF